MPRAEYESIIELVSRRTSGYTIRAVVSQQPGGQDVLALELIEHRDEGEPWHIKRRQIVDHGAIDTVGELRFVGDTLYFKTDVGTDSEAAFAVEASEAQFARRPERVER